MKMFGLACLLIAAGLAWPASADFSVRANIGNVHVRVGNLHAHPGRAHRKWRGHKARRHLRPGEIGVHPKRKRRPYRFGQLRYRPVYVYDRDDDRDEPPPPEPVAPPAPPPEPEVEPEPLDPAGAMRLVAARGSGLIDRPWTVGEPLPAGLPHVTLDPRHYDLPAPPPGQIYARVRHDVLLIDPMSRVVHAEVTR